MQESYKKGKVCPYSLTPVPLFVNNIYDLSSNKKAGAV